LPVGKHWFDISSVDELPQVTILYGHRESDAVGPPLTFSLLTSNRAEGFDESLIDAAVANGAKGIVILGSGAGAISSGAAARSAAVMAKGIPVVVSIRSASGASPPSIYENGV
jgi:L-asparaginase